MYYCEKCGNEIKVKFEIAFCPFCGGSDFRKADKKSRVTAGRLAKELQGLIPALEKSFREYAEIQAKASWIKLELNQYAHRGIIDKSEIPELPKLLLSEYLREYRAKRKEAEK